MVSRFSFDENTIDSGFLFPTGVINHRDFDLFYGAKFSSGGDSVVFFFEEHGAVVQFHLGTTNGQIVG